MKRLAMMTAAALSLCALGWSAETQKKDLDLVQMTVSPSGMRRRPDGARTGISRTNLSRL